MHINLSSKIKNTFCKQLREKREINIFAKKKKLKVKDKTRHKAKKEIKNNIKRNICET